MSLKDRFSKNWVGFAITKIGGSIKIKLNSRHMLGRGVVKKAPKPSSIHMVNEEGNNKSGL